MINLANLYVLTVLLVYFFGWLRMFLVFQASSLGGTVLSWAIGTERSVGASGALLECWECLLCLGGNVVTVYRSKTSSFENPCFWGGLSLLSGFVIPMIDNSAHIGGLLVGLTMGMIAHNCFPNGDSNESGGTAEWGSSGCCGHRDRWKNRAWSRAFSGIAPGDGSEQLRWMADEIVNLQIPEDEKWENESFLASGGRTNSGDLSVHLVW